ncbi:MAG: DUF4147 domain-containing protein [bacterium]|nr:DUF4147 domain-containing protein [bacterium]
MYPSISAVQIAREGIKAAHPLRLVPQYIKVEGNILHVTGRQYDISRGIKFLAFGKAALSMSEALVECVGASFIRGGIVVAPEISKTNLTQYAPRIELIQSTHPFVSETSLAAGKRVLAFADACTKEDVVVCLVSGGGSALVAHPVDGISFEEKVEFINNLMGRGIAEREVNVIRKGLSAIKGGKLAARLAPALIINMILSDERTHQEEANASGPTVPNNATTIPRVILEEAGLWDAVSVRMKNVLEQSRPLNAQDLARVDIYTCTIKGREAALAGMEDVARKMGFNSVTVDMMFFHEMTHGSVDGVAGMLGNNYRSMWDSAKPGTHVALGYGEIIVKAKKGSQGGRCQHLAALMLNELKEMPTFEFAAIASDGCDFVHGIQGAVINNKTVQQIAHEQIDYFSFIKSTQTYELHRHLRSLVKGGYTGTNVNDLYVFIFQKSL